MANPTRLRWTHDKRNTDGSAFTAEQFAGFLLEINGAGAVSAPAAWDEDGAYELPLVDLAAVSQEETATYTMRMAVTNREGRQSEWSAPVQFMLDFRVPTAPAALSVG